MPPIFNALIIDWACALVSAALPKSNLVTPEANRLGAQVLMVAKLAGLTATVIEPLAALAIFRPFARIVLTSSRANSLA